MDYTGCFEDKVYIITGGAGACGGSTAIELVRHGACVSLIDLDEGRLQQVAEQCIKAGADISKVMTFVGSTSDEETCKDFVNETVKKFGKVDGLFNVVGRKIGGSLHTASWSDFENTYRSCIKSTFQMMQQCLPHLKETKGCVLNMAGNAGVNPCYHALAYGVFLAAMDRFTEATAHELSSFGIRVNGLSPVALVTDNYHRSCKPMTDEDLQGYYNWVSNVVPLGRPGTPDDVVQASLFLLSDRSSFTTGYILPITGGYEHTTYTP